MASPPLSYPTNMRSIITHKDGNDKAKKAEFGKQPFNEIPANLKRDDQTDHIDNKSPNDKDNILKSNKDEYGCHFVSRNPRFLASISYPSNVREPQFMAKANKNIARKESRVRQNKFRNVEGSKINPKKVIFLRLLHDTNVIFEFMSHHIVIFSTNVFRNINLLYHPPVWTH